MADVGDGEEIVANVPDMLEYEDDEDKELLIKYWGGGWKVLEFNNNNNNDDCSNNNNKDNKDEERNIDKNDGKYTFRNHIETWLRYLHNHVNEFQLKNFVNEFNTIKFVNEELENFHPTKNLIRQFLAYMLIRYAYLDKFLTGVIVDTGSTTSTTVSTFHYIGPIFSLECNVTLLQKRSNCPSKWNTWENKDTLNFIASKGFVVVKLHINWLTMV